MSIILTCILKTIWCTASICNMVPTGLVDAATIAETVDDHRLWIVAGIESRLDRNARSPADAYGLFQVTQIAENHVNEMHKLTLDRHNYVDNILIAKLYWKWLGERYKYDYWRMLVGYNWGPARSDGIISGDNLRIPEETRNYIKRFNQISNTCLRPLDK